MSEMVPQPRDGHPPEIQFIGDDGGYLVGYGHIHTGLFRALAITAQAELAGVETAIEEFFDDGPGFALTCHPDTLELPFAWRTPRRVFVNSMSDLFHPDIPDAFIMAVFSTMLRCRRHTYQILTKRPQRLASWLSVWGPFSEGGPGGHDLEHIWLGTSIESDKYVWRANHLRDAPGAIVRFLSLEPLLGPLPSLDLTGIDWVIVGAESGHGARPMDLGWVRDIRDQCIESCVSFFFKQDAVNGHKLPVPELDGVQWMQYPDEEAVAR
jgi:protein gp37